MQEGLPEGSLPKRLWQQQEGYCPECGQLIEEEERWALQPAVPLQDGGTRPLATPKMLHSSCQRLFRRHADILLRRQPSAGSYERGSVHA